MSEIMPVETWLTVMDGVLVRGRARHPGSERVYTALRDPARPFLVLTNNPMFTPRDLRARLLAGGIDVPEQSIWSSALATARFMDDPRSGGTAYVIGEAGRPLPCAPSAMH